MKQFFLKLALLFLPIIIGMRFLANFDQEIISDDLIDVNRVLVSKPFDSLDCLFLGSSYTYSSINPRAFDSLGWKSYNLSVGGTGIYFIELILEDYLQAHQQTPKQVIIDISPQTFSNQTDDWTAYAIHRYLLRPISHEAVVWRYTALGDYFKLLRKSAFKGVKNIGKKRVATKRRTDSTTYYRGFYANYTQRNELIKQRDAKLLNSLLAAKIDPAKWQHLLVFVDYCKDRNIKLYWFLAPIPDLMPYYRKPYLEKYNELLKDLREIPMAIEIPIDESIFDESDYRNTDHLNVWGAKKMGEQIISYFKKNKVL